MSEQYQISRGSLIKFKWLLWISIVGIGLVSLIAWSAHGKIEKLTRENVENTLSTVLQITEQALRFWFLEHKSEIKIWVNHPKILENAQILLTLPKTSAGLNSPSEQENLRTILRPVIKAKSYSGFFVTDLKGMVLAAASDEDLGVLSLLGVQEEFFNSVLSGDISISAPQNPDLAPKNNSNDLIDGLPITFVAAPIRDNQSKIIAILAFHINSSGSFSTILRHGRIGGSGETYAFDKHGHMLSESRFKRQIADLDIITDNSHNNEKIILRDPGVNLVAGETSTMPGDKRPLTRMAASALSGKSEIDTDGYNDYRGVPVVGAWTWSRELDMGLATEIDVGQVYDKLRASQQAIIVVAILLNVLIFGTAIIYIRGVENREYARKTEDRRNILVGVLENIPQGVVMFDSDKNMTAWNSPYKKLLGLSDNDIKVGTSNWDLAYGLAARGYMGEGDPHEIATKRLAFLWGSKSTRVDTTFNDGCSYDISTQKSENGELIISYTDITDRVAAEKKVKEQRDELEKLNFQKSRLFSILAHDLKNPFSGLIGFSYLLSDDVKNLEPHVITERANFIHKSSLQLYDIMDNLLQWANSQIGLTKLDLVEIQLKNISQREIDVQKLVADEKGIQLINTIDDNATIFADSNLSTIVIRNLLSNAIKFTLPGGKINLSSVELGNWTEIKIEDTGVGMSAKKIDDLFKIEKNQSTKGTNDETGTGLGLLLCKEFVERQGGELKIESQEGVGSTISFTLPVSKVY